MPLPFNRIKFRAVGRQKQHKQPLCLPGWPKCLHRLALVNRAIILNDEGERAGLGPLLSRFGGELVHHFDIALAIEATDCEGIVEALIRIPYPENADSLASARCLLKPFLHRRDCSYNSQASIENTPFHRDTAGRFGPWRRGLLAESIGRWLRLWPLRLVAADGCLGCASSDSLFFEQLTHPVWRQVNIPL